MRLYEHITTPDAHATEAFAFSLAARAFFAGNIIALYGDLGAGKTAFTRGAAAFFGAADAATSPSYSLINEYRANGNNGVAKILHLDMYRISSEEDFLSLGFDDLLDAHTLTFIEWFDVIQDFFPPADIRVDILKLESGKRGIFVKSLCHIH